MQHHIRISAGLMLIGLLILTVPAFAQDRTPRFGVGIETLVNVFSNSLSNQEFGLGLRARVAQPINTDASLAAGIGFIGFLAGGSNNATYLIHPQLSVVVTLDGSRRIPYVLAGIGGIYPTKGGESGWVFHAGYGWVWPLTDSSVFLEIDPGLMIQDEQTILLIPVRFGVIF